MGMRMTLVMTAVLVAALLHVDVSAQKGYETFNRALAAEKADGDLRAAIRLYEQAIREAGKDRQLASRALLRIGDCYRRLGDAQARTAFSRILNEFAEQTDVVAEARSRLEPTSEAGAVRLAVTLDGSIQFDGPINADGRLGGTDWSTGDVILGDVVTSSVSRVAAGGGPGAYPAWGENPLLSPDGRQVAYQWFDDTSGETRHQLRLVSTVPGSKPRTLVDDLARVRNIYPISWSPDARRLLVGYEVPVTSGSSQPSGQGDFQLAWMSATDGTMTLVRRFEWWRSAGANSLGLMSVSPDRRFIAYAAAPSQGSAERSIYVMSIDGTTSHEAVTGGLNESPVWTPDGRGLVFVSDRAGSFGVWAVGFQNGNSGGFVSAIKPNTGRVRLHGFTASGVMYYSAYIRIDETFVAPISRDGRLTAGVAATESTPGNNPAWSPDGKFLAFKRRNNDGRFDLVVRNMETGREMKWSGNTGNGRPLGNALVYWVANNRLMADAQTPLEVVGDELRRAGDVAIQRRGSVARDGSVLYAPAGETEASVELIEPLTGQRKGSFQIPEPVAFVALNPSGDTLAMVNPRRLSVVRVDGTGYREVYVVPAGRSNLLPSVRWAGDGRSLLFTVDGPGQIGMMRVAVSGGQPEPGGLVGTNAVRFDISPDGTRIAYTNRKESVEVWSLRAGQLPGR